MPDLIQLTAQRWLRISVGAVVVVLALLNLLTLVFDPMPADHHVAVPIATVIMLAAWFAELAGMRWPRLAFALAAAAPNIWLAAIGHVTLNLLLLMPLIGWVTYTGSRVEGLGALALSLSTVVVAMLRAFSLGEGGVSGWINWIVGLLAIWVMTQLIIRQERLVVETRRLRTEAEERVRELERLNQQVQQVAALEERQRLARELHDSVSQALHGIALGARTARTLLDRDPPRAIQAGESVLSLAEAGIAEMRALIFELRPESLANEGLVAALEKHAAALRARYSIDVHTVVGGEPEVPLAVKEALYRIAQEAMHNTVKHAQAKQVTLHLTTEDGELALAIGDDGVGFNPAEEFPGHLGLKSMRERMERLGGTLHIESAPGAGTRIRASVPAE